MKTVYKVEDRDETGVFGTITYDSESKTAVVDLPISKARLATMRKFFTEEREFRIPRSQEIDDYDEVVAKPVDSLNFFELALSELWASTGIFVLWGF
jgi:hypothetical protein